MKFLLILYQKISNFLSPTPSCRFYPSCSNYALEAIQKHGIIIGAFLALKRLIRCNQWFPGGYDPVSCCIHKSGSPIFSLFKPKIEDNVSHETL